MYVNNPFFIFSYVLFLLNLKCTICIILYIKMNNKIKGDLYEKYIRKLLSPISKQVWLWKDIPEKHLLKAGLIHDLNEHRLERKRKHLRKEECENKLEDTGIDILQLKDKEYIFIQCKNYKNTVRVEDLAGFWLMMLNHQDKKGVVYYTSRLSIHITENAINKRIEYKRVPMSSKVKVIEDNKKVYDLYEYQKDALCHLTEYFKENKRGILNMPCSTGKTLISCYFAKNYKHTIIISPLRQFAQQNMNKFMLYNEEYKSLLVDSDDKGCRDVEYIHKFLERHRDENVLLSSTYKSVDIVNQIIDEFNANELLIIVDEFHNLSRNNVLDENDEFYKLLNNKKLRMLFMSATPRIYELENSDEDDDFKEYFGEKAYYMSMSEAIENKYICDYKIYIPDISENIDEVINEVNSEINVTDLDREMEAKCIFIAKCMAFKGSRKCIAYFQNTSEIYEFIRTFKSIEEYYALDIEMDHITYNDTEKQRNEKINKFRESDKFYILCSVRILDECVDIPECDSIYITYNSQSKIRNVQRINRATRLDKNNVNKVAYIYLWCNDHDKLPEMLSSLKEYDELFKDKIRLMKSSYNDSLKSIKEVKEKTNNFISKYVVNLKEYKRLSFDEWKELLFEYCDEYNKIPTQKTQYKNYNIGQWLSFQKKKLESENDDIYKKLSENRIVKESLDKYLSKYLKNKRRDDKPDKISWDKWKILLFDYCDEYGKHPTRKIQYKNYNIGRWLQDQKTKLESENDEIYKKLSENRIVKEVLDKYLENKRKDDKPEKISWDEWKELLFDYCDKNNKIPTNKTKYKNYNIGQWLSTQKKKLESENDDIYKKLSENKIVKESLDKYLENKRRDDKHDKISWDEWKELLFDYCNKYNKHPTKKIQYKNYNIGHWLQDQKTKLESENDEIYKKLSENRIVKESLDKYLKNKRRDDKPEKISWNEWKELLFDYCDKNNKIPTNKTKYKNYNIGHWLQYQKTKLESENDEIYKKLSENRIVKEVLDKYLRRKLNKKICMN